MPIRCLKPVQKARGSGAHSFYNFLSRLFELFYFDLLVRLLVVCITLINEVQRLLVLREGARARTYIGTIQAVSTPTP